MATAAPHPSLVVSSCTTNVREMIVPILPTVQAGEKKLDVGGG